MAVAKKAKKKAGKTTGRKFKPTVAGVSHRQAAVVRAIRPQHVEAGAQSVTPRDLARVLRRAPELVELFAGGALAKLAGEVETARELLADFAAGSYGRVSYRTVARLVFALRYALREDDIASHTKADDEVVVRLALELSEADLSAYRRWRQEKP